MTLNDTLRFLGFKPHPSNWKHFWAGLFFAAGSFLFCFYELKFDVWMAFGISSFAALFLGFTKEIFDYYINPKHLNKSAKPNFDWLDLIMTFLGGISVCVLLTAITFVT